MTAPLHVGALLRAVCDHHARATGASYTDIADRAGVSQPSLARSFSRADAAPATLRAVLSALGLHVEVRDAEGRRVV